MGFRFYNSYIRDLEDFKPADDNTAKIYSCGPTVYNYAHIGNYRSYIFADLLNRSLRAGGYHVEHAMNITDVDDKTMKGARELAAEKNRSADLENLKRFTDTYTSAFFEDLDTLGVIKMNHHPRATESIEPMVDLVKKLQSKDLAYSQDGSVYFSINKYSNYGRLSKVDLSSVKTGLRYNTDEYTKDDIRDFVLWKAEPATEKMAWQTELGYGRPGWHLECSAMIRDIFNGPVDIHTGGVDLLFPHHENEIAQSENAYNEDFVYTWMHCEHLLVEGHKMSKSAGNFYTLREILDKGHHPAAIRYLLMSVHYRQKLNFTFEGLDQALAAIKRILNLYNRLESASASTTEQAQTIETAIDKHRKDFLEALQEDLNIAKALAAVHESVRMTHAYLDKTNDRPSEKIKGKLLELFKHFDSVLNLLRYADEFKVGNEDIPENLTTMLEQRAIARKEKNFAEADRLRDEITRAGYQILDTAEGARLQKIR